MIKVFQVDLRGKIPRIRDFHFVSFEWWNETPRFVLLRYAYGDHVVPQGLRMDLDKRAILDDVEDEAINRAIRKNAGEIWKAVVSEHPAIESSSQPMVSL